MRSRSIRWKRKKRRVMWSRRRKRSCWTMWNRRRSWNKRKWETMCRSRGGEGIKRGDGCGVRGGLTGGTEMGGARIEGK